MAGSPEVTAPRRGLAVVRAGDNSLHPHWAVDTTAFDVAISYFGQDDSREFPEARYVHRLKAGKWDGIASFFQAFPDVQDAYDYFWFPDDDLDLTAAKADALLAAGIAHNLDLWQPSLDRQSYFGLPITLHIPGLTLRHTNFVEIMAPVLSRRLLQATLPLFSTTRSGFGLDYLWPQMVEQMRHGATDGCAVLDGLTITHTRPVGSVLKKVIATASGPTSREEFAQVLALVKHRNPLITSMGLSIPRKRTYRAVRNDGSVIAPWRLLFAAWRAMVSRQPRMQSVRTWKMLSYTLTAFY